MLSRRGEGIVVEPPGGSLIDRTFQSAQRKWRIRRKRRRQAIDASIELLRGDNLVELRQVRTGRANGDMVEVIGSLKPGDIVVTNGAVFIDRAISSLDDFARKE